MECHGTGRARDASGPPARANAAMLCRSPRSAAAGRARGRGGRWQLTKSQRAPGCRWWRTVTGPAGKATLFCVRQRYQNQPGKDWSRAPPRIRPFLKGPGKVWIRASVALGSETSDTVQCQRNQHQGWAPCTMDNIGLVSPQLAARCCWCLCTRLWRRCHGMEFRASIILHPAYTAHWPAYTAHWPACTAHWPACTAP
eukprot:357521-Chlamydomonas_euryale.AAC.1